VLFLLHKVICRLHVSTNKLSSSKHVAYILPCVIKTAVLTYKLVLQYVSKHLVMSSFKLVKGKAVPLQTWTGPEGSRKLRF